MLQGIIASVIQMLVRWALGRLTKRMDKNAKKGISSDQIDSRVNRLAQAVKAAGDGKPVTKRQAKEVREAGDHFIRGI